MLKLSVKLLHGAGQPLTYFLWKGSERMAEEQMIGLELEPISEEDIAVCGVQLSCTCGNSSGRYNADCCMHDCKQEDGSGTRWVSGWS